MLLLSYLILLVGVMPFCCVLMTNRTDFYHLMPLLAVKEDPQQDFAFSFDSCSSAAPKNVNIRIGTILRYPIRELSVDVSLTINGKKVPIYSKQICERDHPRFSFCGKKRGEYIYYEGPVSTGFHQIPQGDFNVTVQLFNEDHHTIICGEFTIKS